MKNFFLLLILLLTVELFGQGNNYWIKFKDKNNNNFSLSNASQFLSPQSLNRRTSQHISLDESDLPLTESYINNLWPFISTITHRLKWFNLVVVTIDNPGMIQTTVFEKKDTVFATDTFSLTIHDSITVHYQISVSPLGTTYDTLVSLARDTLRDTILHPGPIIIRDSIFQTDQKFGNKFDSIRLFAFVDSLAGIEFIPNAYFKSQEKFEEVHTIDQQIIYPNKYGAAYHQLNMLNGDLLHQLGYHGEGMVISVMDNGFANVDSLAAFDTVRSNILGTYDFVHKREEVYDDGGHGTSTFSCMGANLPGTFIGSAPGANYYLFQTEDNSAEWVMEEYNWAAAAQAADSLGVQIFSTSLGYSEFNHGIGNHRIADLTGDKAVITHASNMAFKKGILVINSAGNTGDDAWYFISMPGDGNDVLTVGAVDSAKTVANFSGRGPNAAGRIKPDVCAQGAGSAFIQTNGAVGTGDGTSFSCPILAGCAACLWSAFPDKSAREIYDAIVNSADHFPSPDNNHGYGIPNFYNAYLQLKTNYNGSLLRLSNDAVIFPNPFGAELNISLFNSENKSRKIEIFDLLGRKIYSHEIFIRDKTFEIARLQIDPFLPVGEYILRLDGEKDKTHRIIKIKHP